MKKIALILSFGVVIPVFASHKVKIKNKAKEPVRAVIFYGAPDAGKYDTLFLNVGMEKKVSIDHDDNEGFCCPGKVVIHGMRSQSNDMHSIDAKRDEHAFKVVSDGDNLKIKKN